MKQSIMEKALYWITDRLPIRIIDTDQGPYLERYFLAAKGGKIYYLHHFIGSDDRENGFHDHPWRAAYSFVLSGWYWEHKRSGTRKIRRFNRLDGDTFHLVELPESGKTCWTLFIHDAGDQKEWGFMKPIDNTRGWQMFKPYQYNEFGGKKPFEWWHEAPKGRDYRQHLRNQ